jgi:hypothetical protein
LFVPGSLFLLETKVLDLPLEKLPLSFCLPFLEGLSQVVVLAVGRLSVSIVLVLLLVGSGHQVTNLAVRM